MEMEPQIRKEITMFDYHCTKCSYDFFFEEGYVADEDVIVCPYCGQHIEQKGK
jgi:DNA-directed RNA polymerase subunit RPC12/RpoP